MYKRQSAISGLSIEKVSLAALPYVIALIAVLVVITFVPQISTFLPSLMK